MKSLLSFILLSLFATAPALAISKPLEACAGRRLQYLNESIQEQIKEKDHGGYYLLLNSQDQLVGFFAWSHEGHGSYAEVCDRPDTETTVASQWYYWDDNEVSSDPQTWDVGYKAQISQDEGWATANVLARDADGNMTIHFRMFGIGEELVIINGTEEVVEVLVRSEILKVVRP